MMKINNSERGLFFLSISGDIISKLLKISLQAVIARSIGLEAFGIYVLILTIVGVMQVFTIFGMNYTVLKEGRIFFLKKNNEFIIYLASACIVSLTLSLFCIIFINHFSNTMFLELFGKIYHHPKVIFMFTLSVLFLSIISITGYALRSIDKLSYDILITQVVLPFLTFAFVSFFLLIKRDLESVAFGVLLGSMVVFLVSVTITSAQIKKVFDFRLRFKKIKKTIGDQLRFTYPIVLGGLLFILMRSVDKFILSAYFSSSEVGLYSAAFNLSLYLYSFVFIFNKIYAPYFSELHNEGNIKGIKKLFDYTSDNILRLLLPISAFMIIFAEEIIVLIYGAEFATAATMLVILVIGVTLSTFEGVSSMALIMLGKQKYEFYNNLVGLISVIVFGYLLIKNIGVTGMAFAFLISYFIIFWLIFLEIKLGFNISIVSVKLVKRILSFFIILLFMFVIKLLSLNFLYIVICLLVIYPAYSYFVIKNLSFKIQ